MSALIYGYALGAMPETGRYTVGTFVPSPQQAAVFNWVKDGTGNAIIRAVAGSGKTTLLLNAMSLMQGRVAYLVFNKKNAVEANVRLEHMGLDTSRIQASTVHSAGFSAFKQTLGKGARSLKVNANKLAELYDAEFPTEKEIEDPLRGFVLKAVAMSKDRAFGIVHSERDIDKWIEMINHFGLDENLPGEEGDEDALLEAVDRCVTLFTLSKECCGKVVDFGDMIWAPLYFKVKFQKYDWVLLDECQDTSTSRRLLAQALMGPRSRFIAVGDEFQGIYGFSGADNNAMLRIEQELHCARLPLTVTFRCPRAVVEVAREYDYPIEAHESAPQGSTRTINQEDFLKEQFLPSDYIICRYNKPLAALAYSLLRRKIPCRIEGRDIGKGLIAFTKKWKATSLESFYNKLSDYRDQEVKKLLDKGQEAKAESLSDRIETVLTLSAALLDDGKRKVEDLVQLILSLFSDSAEERRQVTTLMTGHKSKGLETDRVYWLGYNVYNPSKFAVKDWQIQQEKHICIVTATRAKKELVKVSVSPST